MNDSLDADAMARQAALDTSRSILLQAPAGSGKTTVLVSRYLRLLAEANAPEEVLAITFTRKAAGEMRARVLAALQRAAAGDVADFVGTHALAALRQANRQGWQLQLNAARLRIMTIDSANLALAAQAPVQSGSGTRLQVAAQPGLLYRAAAAQAVRSALDDPALAPAVTQWLERLDNQWQQLESLLAAMLARRSEWLPLLVDDTGGTLAERVNDSLQKLVVAELSRCQAILPADLLAACSEIGIAVAAAGHLQSSAAAEWSANQSPLSASSAHLPRWQMLARLLLTKDLTWRKDLTKSDGVPASATALRARCRQWLADMKAVPGAELTWVEVALLPTSPLPLTETRALQSLSALLLHAASELQLQFVVRERVDFTQVAGAARQVLTVAGAPTERALRGSEQLQHLLIDEFQDTSLEQLDLIRALTAGWTAGDGRTLFMVGDPMQSIYQFRRAEVGNFLRVRDRGLGELTVDYLQLQKNFRSRAPLVSWVNVQCARLFPVTDDERRGAIRFLPAAAATVAEPAALMPMAAAVTVHAMAGYTPEDAGAEAATVVQLVRAAWRSKADATIAVLVANRRHASEITRALQQAAVAVRGIKMTALGDRAVVRDLLALARALQHLADRTAWLALLRGPWCGLDLQALESLSAGGEGPVWNMLQDERQLATLSAADSARVRRLYVAMQPAMQGADLHEPLAVRLHHSWLRLGGAALCRNERELADARACIAAIEEHDAAELLTGGDFDFLIDELYATAEENPRQVDIMTIHGAKGLEWDVVIAPALGRQRQSERLPLLQTLQLPGSESSLAELLVAPLRASDGGNDNTLSQYITRLTAERRQLERVRLLYVLVTRARQAVHLFGHVARRANGDWLPDARSMLADLWPAVADEFRRQLARSPAPPATAVAAAIPAANAVPAGVVRQRLPLSWTLQPRPLRLQRLSLPVPSLSEQIEYRWVGQTARAMGTVVHAELQRLSGNWAAREPAAAGQYRAWLAELGVPVSERVAADADVRRALSLVLADARGRWLLDDTQHQSAASEVRLSGMHRGELVNIRMDRMLIDRAGVRWVIDYKTNRHEGGAREQFIAQELQRYRPQLERYASLAAQLGTEPVRCALYFPLLGEFRVLEVS